MFKIDISFIVLSTIIVIVIGGIIHTTNNTKLSIIRSGDMLAEWEITGDHITFTIRAPTKGWVAFGINQKPQLKGTNLIMGAAEHGFYKLEDQYISKPGDHKVVTLLGGTEAPVYRHVWEHEHSTKLIVTIPMKASDKFHYDLTKGATYYLLLAYSTSDDFGHHSRYRTFEKITL